MNISTRNPIPRGSVDKNPNGFDRSVSNILIDQETLHWIDCGPPALPPRDLDSFGLCRTSIASILTLPEASVSVRDEDVPHMAKTPRKCPAQEDH
jgi:hypothetical protein